MQPNLSDGAWQAGGTKDRQKVLVQTLEQAIMTAAKGLWSRA